MSEILIVDDELSIRSTFREFLVKAGHHVEVATGGLDAIRLVQRRPFDLVLLDIILSDSMGDRVMREIRDVSPRTRIVLMTGYPTVESLSDAIRFGAADYLFKPVSKECLVTAVARALGRIVPSATANYAIA